jgi:hypothetical protein
LAGGGSLIGFRSGCRTIALLGSCDAPPSAARRAAASSSSMRRRFVGFDALGFPALVLLSFAFGALRFFRLATLRLSDFVDLPFGLLLEYVTLDVGALDAHLDVHRPRTTCTARELDFALLLALQRDLARRGRARRLGRRP